MVSEKYVKDQLKRLDFKVHGWGRGEVNELPHILIPDEEIYDLVNGIYEGGFALLVATDIRLILVDKKPLNFLTVEDLRFDMINEIDYSHRLMGAHVSVSAGNKNLRFRSYNQHRLRKVITHVQHLMANSKKQESSHQKDQKDHLEQINQQLQTYLIAQHQQQEELRHQLQTKTGSDVPQQDLPDLPDMKAPAELADYLYAQSLLAEYRRQEGRPATEKTEVETQAQPASRQTATPITAEPEQPQPAPKQLEQSAASPYMNEIYADAKSEIFGKRERQVAATYAGQPMLQAAQVQQPTDGTQQDVDALNIANAKLPMAMRNRKFGRPSFHAHSQAEEAQKPTTTSSLSPA